jgi:nitrogen fixation protein NifU and related proteins
MGKFSETLSEHVMAPRNGGAIEGPDLTGHACAPGRGAFMILYLKVQDERITAAKYHTVGCGPTIASGSMLTEMIAGKSIAECRELTVENLIEALDGVPPDKLHCPALAIGALKDALAKWTNSEGVTSAGLTSGSRGSN